MHRLAAPLAALLVVAATTPAFAGGGLPLIASVRAGPFEAALHNDSPTLTTGPNLISVELASLPADHVVSLRLDGPRGEAIAVPLSKVTVLDGPEDAHGGAEGAHGKDAPTEHGAASAADDGGMATMSHGTQPAKVQAQPTPASSPEGMAAEMDHAAMVHGSAMEPADHAVSAPGADPRAGASSDDHMVADAHDQAALHLADEASLPGGESYLARGQVSLPSTGHWIAQLVIRDRRGEIYVGQTALEVVEGGPNRLYLGATGSLIAGALLFGTVQRRRQLAGVAGGR